MKKVFTLVFTMLSVLVGAQTMTPDTINMGPGYGNDVYYNVFNRQKATASNLDWHLMFMCKPRTSSIRINSGRGVRLYRVPNADIYSFSTFDTTNWKQFPELHDQFHSWETDAFYATANSTNPFDYGWGDYSQTSHHVVGDSLYILELPNGLVKKLSIDTLLYDSTFIFRYANLDNSDLQTVYLNKLSYPGKFYVYYNMNAGQIADKEPVDSTWQLKFTRYSDLVPSGPGQFAYYPVVGVLANQFVQVAKVFSTVPELVNPSGTVFLNNINQIGGDWKAFDQSNNVWSVNDSQVYFVRVNRKNKADSVIYNKMVFTWFGGSTTGKIAINTSVHNMGTALQNNQIPVLGVFPNPYNNYTQITLDNISGEKYWLLDIIDMSGKIIDSRTIQAYSGMAVYNINYLPAEAGIYTVRISGSISRATVRLVKYE